MIIQNVTLPPELLLAQKEGRLVIFVGAGVSNGPPSNLPLFGELATAIAEGAFERDENESDDRFLGRLHNVHKVKVHERAVKALTPPNSTPTPLHFNLLKLFRSQEDLRVVTTNFDLHLTTALKESFGDATKGIDINRAPALPLGDKFSGLVYLHGNVERPKDMVLTDADFGEAYLIKGYTRRFLVSMFNAYDVLFVGYSGDDVVMHYLTCGLAPETPGKRWAFCSVGKAKEWKLRSVKPLPYHKTGNGEPHPLSSLLAEWVRRSQNELVEREIPIKEKQLGFFEHESRIKELVEREIPADCNFSSLATEDESYLLQTLEKDSTARLFTRYAKSVAWLKWCSAKGLLKPLFDPSAKLTAVELLLADWLVNQYLVPYSDSVLSILQASGSQLNPMLWVQVCVRLGSDQIPSEKVFADWTLALIRTSTGSPLEEHYPLAYLLKACGKAKYDRIGILLFEYLIQPEIRLRPNFRLFRSQDESDEEVPWIEIGLRGERYWLDDYWEKSLRPRLAQLHQRLEPILTRALESAFDQMEAIEEAGEEFDPFTTTRSAIEPHEQDSLRDDKDVLIDGCRDILDFLLVNDPESAKQLLMRWRNSRTPILHRLYLYGLERDPRTTPETKLEVILTRDWLYRYSLKHEVFMVLKAAYPQADEPTRRRIVETAQTRLDSGYERVSEKRRAFVKYSLLHWLTSNAPDCKIAKSAYDREQELHPEFTPEEHPDLNAWYSSSSGHTSPKSLDELLAKPATEWTDYLLTYEAQGFEPVCREGLLDSVRHAAATNFQWSYDLAADLLRRKNYSTDVWESVLRGWDGDSLTREQFLMVIELLHQAEQLPDDAYGLGGLLQRIDKYGDAAFNADQMDTFLHLWDRVWNSCEIITADVDSTNRDWLSTAINRDGGKTAQALVDALAMEARRSQKQELPEAYAFRLEQIAKSNSPAGILGRVVLAWRLNLFVYLDTSWTRRILYPLLDWNLDPMRASQTWAGLLSSHRAIGEDLIPAIIAGFQYVKTHFSDRNRRSYSELVADMALLNKANPVKDGFLPSYILAIGASDREVVAERMGARLQHLSPSAVIALWGEWLGEYLSDRASGVPIGFNADDEMRKVLDWIPVLLPVITEVEKHIERLPIPPFTHTTLFRDLAALSLTPDAADSVTRIVAHLLSAHTPPRYFLRDIEGLCEKLISAKATKEPLKRILERLGELGSTRASDLWRMLDEIPDAPTPSPDS